MTRINIDVNDPFFDWPSEVRTKLVQDIEAKADSLADSADENEEKEISFAAGVYFVAYYIKNGKWNF